MQFIMLNNIFLPDYSQTLQIKKIPLHMSNSFFSYFIFGGSTLLLLLFVIKIVLYIKKSGDYDFQLHYSVMDIVLSDDYRIKKVMKIQNIISGVFLVFSILFLVGLFLFH